MLDKGITISEFHDMTFTEFWEVAEVKNRKELRELRLHRNLLQMFTSDDMRFKMPLPGDFDNTEGIGEKTQEELQARVRKLGLGKLLNIDGKSS